MILIDLFLLRILLTGLIISLLLGLFLLLRQMLPRAFSPGLRRIIWLVLLFASLMIILFPFSIKMPSDLPLWFFHYRLPEPVVSQLSEQTVTEFFALDLASLNSLAGEGDESFADTVAKTMRALELLPTQNWQDKIRSLIPWLRIIYLGGFIIAFVSHLIYYFKDIRKKMMCRMIDETGREAWQADIASMRDQFGNYRQADVMMYDCDCDRPSRWLKNWRKHILPVPADRPDEMSLSDRKDWLQAHLDFLAHPDLLPIIVWLIVRSVFWFNPFWHSSWCYYSKDLTDTKISRIRHHQRMQTSQNINIIIVLTGILTCLVMLTVVFFLIWQMPHQILPTVNSTQIASKADVPVMTRSIPSNRYTLTDYRVIFNESSLISAADSLSRFDGLTRLDSNGDIVWQSSIYRLLDLQIQPSVETMDTCQIAEDRWSIAVKVGRANIQIPEIWMICVDGLGQPVGRQKIELPDQYGRLDTDYSIGITLAPDGGWIQSIYSLKKVKSAQTALPVLLSQNLLNISRHDTQGQTIWSLDPSSTDLQDIGNTFIMNEKVVKFKSIQQIIPTLDGGCAIITRGQTRLMRINRETDREESVYYYDIDRLLIITVNGEISRAQDLIGKAGYFKVHQAFTEDDGTLYLTGLDTKSDPGSSESEAISFPAIQAINADGTVRFSLVIAESGQYNLRGAMLQNQQLTILLQDVNRGSALYQIDLKGQNQWLNILDSDDGFVPMALVNDDQIVVFANS